MDIIRRTGAIANVPGTTITLPDNTTVGLPDNYRLTRSVTTSTEFNFETQTRTDITMRVSVYKAYGITITQDIGTRIESRNGIVISTSRTVGVERQLN